MTATVVLVHGAFADAASWNGVIDRLQRAGIAVEAVANPLRGLRADAEYVAARAKAIDGPVLLVGHSYGGSVVNAAAPLLDTVTGLVHVAAFIQAAGESPAGISAKFPETPFGKAIRPVEVPFGDGSRAAELHLDPSLYHEVFAADLDPELTRVLAAGQRPVAGAALEDTMPAEPGWTTLPTWTLVATQDQAIHPDAQRFMAERAGGTVIEVDGSHSVAVSHPDAVADLIKQALR